VVHGALLLCSSALMPPFEIISPLSLFPAGEAMKSCAFSLLFFSIYFTMHKFLWLSPNNGSDGPISRSAVRH